MKLAKNSSVEELQLVSRFESLRRVLLSEAYAAHRDKPLAYWAVPTDRRLPLAFLGRTLDELLNTPFSQLADTPGIGQKKIRSFVKLLSRVANSDPAKPPPEAALGADSGRGPAGAATAGGFDPASVSEVVWAQWRAPVRHGQGKETLGRLAPSLKNMTRMIWNTTLESYADKSLEEIRGMKTHGEKRVAAILEVFHGVHSLVASMGSPEHLVVRIVPKLIDSVETWVGRTLQMPDCPGDEEIFIHFVNPLLKQVRIDATRQIAALAENRLGINGPVTSVRQAARTMGLTRARVYQLLNEINDITNVRWPMGRHQVYELSDKLHRDAACLEKPPSLEQFRAAVELFYPGSRRGAAGRLERAEAFGDGQAAGTPGPDQDDRQEEPAVPSDGCDAVADDRNFEASDIDDEPTLATAGEDA